MVTGWWRNATVKTRYSCIWWWHVEIRLKMRVLMQLNFFKINENPTTHSGNFIDLKKNRIFLYISLSYSKKNYFWCLIDKSKIVRSPKLEFYHKISHLIYSLKSVTNWSKIKKKISPEIATVLNIGKNTIWF